MSIPSEDALKERELIVERLRRDARMAGMLARFGGHGDAYAAALNGAADEIERGAHHEVDES